MKYWITTDTHIGHDKLIELGIRQIGVDKIIEEELLKIPEEDVLIHLGDVGWSKGEMSRVFKSIKCKKILVRGNHDKESNNWYVENCGFDFVCMQFRDRINGYDILFSHKPWVDVGYDINIHGHFHNNINPYQFEPELLSIKNPRQCLVAIERTEYKPVPLTTIIDNFKKKQT